MVHPAERRADFYRAQLEATRDIAIIQAGRLTTWLVVGHAGAFALLAQHENIVLPLTVSAWCFIVGLSVSFAALFAGQIMLRKLVAWWADLHTHWEHRVVLVDLFDRNEAAIREGKPPVHIPIDGEALQAEFERLQQLPSWSMTAGRILTAAQIFSAVLFVGGLIVPLMEVTSRRLTVESPEAPAVAGPRKATARASAERAIVSQPALPSGRDTPSRSQPH